MIHNGQAMDALKLAIAVCLQSSSAFLVFNVMFCFLFLNII